MSLSDLLASYGLPAPALLAGFTSVSSRNQATSNDRRVTRKRRHDGSVVHAEPNPNAAEATATTNNNSNGTIHPVSDGSSFLMFLAKIIISHFSLRLRTL